MKEFERFVPNRVETFVCDHCTHVRDLHVFSPTVRGCTVKNCECQGNGTFARPEPPHITEHVEGKLVSQPAPPVVGFRG